MFDGTTALFSGKETSRVVDARAPREGLPSVDGHQAVRPLGLLRILKFTYGLAEAPRPWYLRAKELLAQRGWIEVVRSGAPLAGGRVL